MNLFYVIDFEYLPATGILFQTLHSSEHLA